MKVAVALRRAARFLLDAQSSDGHWTAWALPPGVSRQWATAYIGWRLSDASIVAQAAVDDDLATGLERAATWLKSVEHAEGGWGYDANTPPDADSSALGLLLLNRQTPCWPAAPRLQRFVRSEGGCSTFCPGDAFGAWALSCNEASAMVLLAWSGAPDASAPVLHRLSRALCNARRADGLWDAYWWVSHHQASEAALAALNAAGAGLAAAEQTTARVALEAESPFGATPRSLRLLSLLRLRQMGAQGLETRIRVELGKLLCEQSDDGSWSAEASLRLTRPQVHAPWDHADAGALYTETRRLFATATAFAAVRAADLPVAA